MSIGIIITMPGAVLLVADGRVTKPSEDYKVINDDENKICVINNMLALIKFGVHQVTQFIIEYIRLNIDNEQKISEYNKIAEDASILSGTHSLRKSPLMIIAIKFIRLLLLLLEAS